MNQNHRPLSWGTYEPWQIDQLTRIGETEPARLGALLSTLWRHHPDLLLEVVWGAVEDGSLDPASAARWLGVPKAAIERELSRRRREVFEKAPSVACGAVRTGPLGS